MFAARFAAKLLAKSQVAEMRCLHQRSVSSQYLCASHSPIHTTRDNETLSFYKPNVIRKDKATHADAKVDLDAALGNLFMGHFPLPHWVSLSPLNGKGDLAVAFVASDVMTEGIQMMNRNARHPNKANKGARPCSRVSRRQKKSKVGKRKR